jgi:hypothetical protein
MNDTLKAMLDLQTHLRRQATELDKQIHAFQDGFVYVLILNDRDHFVGRHSGTVVRLRNEVNCQKFLSDYQLESTILLLTNNPNAEPIEDAETLICSVEEMIERVKANDDSYYGVKASRDQVEYYDYENQVSQSRSLYDFCNSLTK